MSSSSLNKGVPPARGWPDGMSLFLPILMLLTLLSMGHAASAAVCGDANSDAIVNVGDVVYIIGYVFKGGPPPEFLCDGDVNGDGALNVGDAVYLVQWIFNGGQPPVCAPGGGLAESGECKIFGTRAGFDETCVIYDYDGQGLLTLQHINAGFNCCPGDIIVDITINDNIIEIAEMESQSACDCTCLYDLNIEVHYLNPGDYTIQFDEPYLPPGDEPLVFVLDLNGPASGSFCLPRSGYPWGGYGAPEGVLTDHSDCLNLPAEDKNYDPPFNQECVEYAYDGIGTLDLIHLNTAFNCCPDQLYGDFSFVGSWIIITETESLEEGGCACLCLFNVNYRITDLMPGVYVLRFDGLYLNGFEEPLTVTLDLTTATSGSFCEPRNLYPWWD